MKKLIIFILLLVAGVSQGQDQKRFEYLDSLNSTRTKFTIDVKGYSEILVDFRGLTTADSIRLYNLLDSASGLTATKFTRDTIPVKFTNTSAQADSINGMFIRNYVKYVASPYDIQLINPGINKLFIKSLDSGAGVLDHTIYIRVRGFLW